MTLDVLISTLEHDGIQRVIAMDLPVVDNVRYIISWQLPDTDNFPGEVPAELIRNDVKVFQLNNRGISANRNNAIEHSTADICLVADDDLKYTPQQLAQVIATFEENPEVELATFRQSGGNNKKYPDYSFDLKERPKNYHITAFEIAFRRDTANGELRFNELFGPGPHLLQANEEGIFIHQALCKGVKCRFFPITIVHHEGITTGYRKMTPGVLMAEGAYIGIVFRNTALLRIPLFAWRNSRRGLTKIFPAMRYLWKGYIYGKRYFNHDGSLKRQPPR